MFLASKVISWGHSVLKISFLGFKNLLYSEHWCSFGQTRAFLDKDEQIRFSFLVYWWKVLLVLLLQLCTRMTIWLGRYIGGDVAEVWQWSYVYHHYYYYYYYDYDHHHHHYYYYVWPCRLVYWWRHGRSMAVKLFPVSDSMLYHRPKYALLLLCVYCDLNDLATLAKGSQVEALCSVTHCRATEHHLP